MNRTDSSHQPHAHRAGAKPHREMVMPRLTHTQMLAILRESGVPETEARRWVDREVMLADVAAEDS